MSYLAMSVEDRFCLKVDMSDLLGCWNWTGAIKSNGYGNLKVGDHYLSAHVVSHTLFCSQVPVGTQVLHRCDNRRCVRPDHLFTGTPKDNMRDMHAKGRNSRAMCKLTDEQVLSIRVARAEKVPLKVLAEKYDVSEAAISMAARSVTFAKLPANPNQER